MREQITVTLVSLTGTALLGTVVVFLGHPWHGVTGMFCQGFLIGLAVQLNTRKVPVSKGRRAGYDRG